MFTVLLNSIFPYKFVLFGAIVELKARIYCPSLISAHSENMTDYIFFLDPQNKSRKSTIYVTDKLQIESNTDCPGSIASTFGVIIDKHISQNFIQIRLVNAKDKSKMYVCNIDDSRFENFRVEQALHVSFDGFLKHLIQLLDNCRKTKLHVSLLMDNQSGTGQLQFYEKGTFKNLVHISLPVEVAPTELIMYALNQAYAALQDANAMAAQKYANLEMEMMQKTERIERLNETVQRLKNDLSEQELVAANRTKEQVMRMEQDFKHMSDTKDLQRIELEKQISAYRARIDALVAENHAQSEQLKKEAMIVAQLRTDNQKLKDNLKIAKEQMDIMKNGQLAQRATTQKNEQVWSELRRQVQSLEEQLKACEKQKSEILAELDAEKNICQIKRNGLKMATEDICNANAIIRKQAAEIVSLNEKIALRTEVALKQEQLIRERGKENEKAKEVLEFVGGAVQNNIEQSDVIKNQLESLRVKTDLLENKYKSRIDNILKELPISNSNRY